MLDMIEDNKATSATSLLRRVPGAEPEDKAGATLDAMMEHQDKEEDKLRDVAPRNPPT